MTATVSSIFFTFDAVNVHVLLFPSPLLSLLRFVSEINSEIHFLFGNCWERGVYLASLSRACTCNWHCWHIAFRLPDVSQYGRCCSPMLCFIYSCIACSSPLSIFRWLSFGFCLFDCVINHMLWLSLLFCALLMLSRFVAHFRQINLLTHQDVCRQASMRTYIHTYVHMYVK